jgi:hypothetical protein
MQFDLGKHIIVGQSIFRGPIVQFSVPLSFLSSPTLATPQNCFFSSFVTADKAVGAQGFKIVWTEVQEGPSCEEFQCKKNDYCIPVKLRCNMVNNCGADDNSDEADCE